MGEPYHICCVRREMTRILRIHWVAQVLQAGNQCSLANPPFKAGSVRGASDEVATPASLVAAPGVCVCVYKHEKLKHFAYFFYRQHSSLKQLNQNQHQQQDVCFYPEQQHRLPRRCRGEGQEDYPQCPEH